MTWNINDPQCGEADNLQVAMRMCSVYALASSSDGLIRYVGQTVDLLENRRKTHIRHARKYANRHLSCWIRKVIADGHEVCITLLEPHAPWNTSEIAWIAKLRGQGCDLVNATAGGEGALGVAWSEDRKRQMSEKIAGRKKSPEHCAALSRARTGKPLGDGVAEKVAASLKGRTPKNLIAVQAANRGMKLSAEVRGRISASLKGRCVTDIDVLRQNIKKATAARGSNSPETIAKMSNSAKAAWKARREAQNVAR